MPYNQCNDEKFEKDQSASLIFLIVDSEYALCDYAV